MEENDPRVRLSAAAPAAVLLLLLGAAALHLKISSRRIEEARKVRRWSRPRLPVHPPDPSITPEHPAYVGTMEAVEEIRGYFSDPANHPARIGPGSAAYEGALARLRRHAAAMLHPLELLALDENEAPFVRGAILDVIALHGEEAVRQFLAGLLADPREHEYVRSKALDLLAAYEGTANFRVLREVYDGEPEFPGRARLVLAIARTRSPRAVPVLLGALEPEHPLDVRCSAAQGLEPYLDRPEVRQRMTRVARGGDPVPLRRAAIGSLASRPGADVDELLRALAEGPGEPEEIRAIAREWIARRNR
ncbi:MAG: hypothetical protein HYY17_14830 [Planctomycetes bacterium]|nr:hypothetical protein [Planctomycetota bacterium]